MDIVTEIPRTEWPLLRELYKSDWPKNIFGYYNIDNYIKWFEKEPDIKNIKIYTLNGDWSDGTYIIVDRYQLLLNTLNKSHMRLLTALSLLDCSNITYFHGYPSVLKPTFDKYLEENKSRIMSRSDSSSVSFYLSKEDAKKFEICCPDEITLKPLKEEHAVIADEVWPFHHEGSLYLLKRLIRLNPSIGAFTKGGELVAWCLRFQIGCLAILQVKESHKRRGLGTLVVKAISKVLAEMDYDIVAPVVESNFPSRNMFEKLGFKIVDKIYWNFFKFKGGIAWKDEYDIYFSKASNNVQDRIRPIAVFTFKEIPNRKFLRLLFSFVNRSGADQFNSSPCFEKLLL